MDNLFYRMHEQELLPCIYGCSGANDELNHYFLCAPLWQIASQALHVEAPLGLSQRLCLEGPTPDTARLLALVFSLYHFSKSRAKELGGATKLGPNAVQRLAFEAALSLSSHV